MTNEKPRKTEAENRAYWLGIVAKTTAQINKLTPNRFDAMEQCYLQGVPVTEIAKAAGITRQQVHRIMADRKALRDAYWADLYKEMEDRRVEDEDK